MDGFETKDISPNYLYDLEFEKTRLEKAMKRIKENSFYGLTIDREEMKKYYESAEFNHAFDKAMERYCKNDVMETCRA